MSIKRSINVFMLSYSIVNIIIFIHVTLIMFYFSVLDRIIFHDKKAMADFGRKIIQIPILYYFMLNWHILLFVGIFSTVVLYKLKLLDKNKTKKYFVLFVLILLLELFYYDLSDRWYYI
jgi:hypothetical protein